jgi:DNA-nicking Smr family endonuclease
MTSDKHLRRARGKLSDEDRQLWNAVARSIRPLRRRALHPDPDESEAKTPNKTLNKAPKTPPKPRVPPHPQKPKSPRDDRPRAAAPQPAAPALSPLARRERARLARGTIAIDARIDLHGLTQSEAHAALARFLRRAQADDARFVLVITGKGAGLGARFTDHDSDFGADRGVLRRQVPLWLRLPEFRSYVVGFEDADTVHGGHGALYVRLRRRR